MPRYIDAEALKEKIFPIGMVDDGNYGINAKAIKVAIDNQPTADVVEVKHGYWKDNNNGTFTCSECGGRASKMDWCGCCGAKMDGKQDGITTTDWLTRGISSEQLAKEKEEAFADVVEVVRCKDCRRYVEGGTPRVSYCTRWLRNIFVEPDDFCSDGERKDT